MLDRRGEAPSEGNSCEDEGWTRVPADEWYPLDQFRLTVTS